jgi:hypothetical protein
MRRLRKIAILILFLVAMTIVARHGTSLRAWAQSQAGLKIISPRSGEKLQQNFVTVEFTQLQQATSPTFELRLDAQDPVHTSNTSYTFSGLNPGPHVLIIQVVDANNTPVMGTRSEVRFTVLPQPTGGATQAPSGTQPGKHGAPDEAAEQAPLLPDGHTSLPLLSVIGFGILVGGVISALKTRPAPNR